MSCIGWIAVGYLQRHKSHINFDLSLEKKKKNRPKSHLKNIWVMLFKLSWKTFMKNPSQIRKWTIYKRNETNRALMQIFVTVNILRSVTFHRRCWLHAINFLFTLVMFCPVCRLFVPFSSCVFFLSQTDGRPSLSPFLLELSSLWKEAFFPLPTVAKCALWYEWQPVQGVPYDPPSVGVDKYSDSYVSLKLSCCW